MSIKVQVTSNANELIADFCEQGVTPNNPNILDNIVFSIAQQAEIKLRENVTQAIASPSISVYGKEPSTGETLSSISTWLFIKTETHVTYLVGSQTRGAQLLWLDQGRRTVYPVNREALWIKKPKLDEQGKPIWRRYARAAPAHYIFGKTMTQLFEVINQIVSQQITSTR